jgi:hypothetical protein
MPIIPSPAATATGLCDTTHTLPGNRSISIGKPIAGFIARIPRSSRVRTTLRAMSLTSSPLWWNSVLETERAGVRMASRFMRTTKLISVLVWGNALRMSAR